MAYHLSPLKLGTQAVAAGLASAALNFLTKNDNFTFTKSIMAANLIKDVVLYNIDEWIPDNVDKGIFDEIFRKKTIEVCTKKADCCVSSENRLKPSRAAYLASFAVFALTLKFASKMTFGQAFVSSAVLITGHQLFKNALGMDDLIPTEIGLRSSSSTNYDSKSNNLKSNNPNFLSNYDLHNSNYDLHTNTNNNNDNNSDW